MENKKEVKKNYLIIAIAILLLSLIGNGIFLSKNNSLKNERNLAVLNADSLLSAKLQLNKQIDDAKSELESCMKQKNELNTVNAELNNEIAKNRIEIEKLSKDNASVGALRKKIKDAQKQKEECESKVNSLNQKIQELEGNISQLDKRNSDLTNEISELKKKLELAKEIKAKNIIVMNYRVVKSKAKPTLKAKKVNRISATIELMENQLADAGNKKVYLVVYSGNKILSDGMSHFTQKKSNGELPYSSIKDINYNNSDQKVIVNYDFAEKLSKGKYKVEVYVDGSLAGKTDFMLK